MIKISAIIQTDVSNLFFNRGGFFGLTLFNRDFLGLYVSTFDSFDITILKSVKYRQIYAGIVICFMSFGVNISWPIKNTLEEW